MLGKVKPPPTGPYNPPPVGPQTIGRDNIMEAQGNVPGGTPQGSYAQTSAANNALRQQMRSAGRIAGGEANTKFQQLMIPADAKLAQQRRSLQDKGWVGTTKSNLSRKALTDRINLNNLNLYWGLM